MPLMLAACWFALGILLAHSWIPVPLLSFANCTFIVLTITALQLQNRLSWLPLAALWITIGAWSWQLRPVPSRQAELRRYADGLSRDVRGRITLVRNLPPRAAIKDADSDNTWWSERDSNPSSALSVDLGVTAVEEVTPDVSRMIPISGGVRVTVSAYGTSLPNLHCGDIVQLPLQLKIPHRFNDPGAWQYEDYLLEQGIGVQATSRTSRLKVIAAGSPSLRCRLSAVQGWASTRMLAFVHSDANRTLPRALRLNENDAAMLNAMLFGDRSRLTQQLRLGFERTGSFHLFVVSGMHVTLLAAMILWFLAKLGLRGGMAILLALPLLTAYSLLTGFGPPVQRALFMTVIFLGARLLYRDRSVLNAVGAAALAELIWSPASLFDASFQMTFLAVIAIAGVAVPLGSRRVIPVARASQQLGELWRDPVLPPSLAQMRVMLRLWGELLGEVYCRWLSKLPGTLVATALWVAELALIGIVAELMMSLPMAIYFHRATIFALPANMLVVPLVGILAPLALISFLTSLISPFVALLPAAATATMLHSMGWAITRIGNIHSADLRVPGLALPVIVFTVTAWTFAIWAVRQSPRWSSAGAVALLAGALAVWWPESPLLTKQRLEVTAVDVGQGDSLLVVGPGGHTMLVDAGGPVGSTGESAVETSGFDIGEEIVSPYLWSRRIRRLDVLVLSHAHGDHMGGMPSIMRNLRPRELWVSLDGNSESYRALIAEAIELGVTIRHLRAGDRIDWDNTEVNILSPDATYINDGDPANNDSLVMQINYGRSSALLEGDAEAASEQTMVARGLAPVTLLKVGHHGSKTSTTESFLAAVQPKSAIISVGRGNSFGHPRGEVIARLAAHGTRLYRTDEFGVTSFLLSEDGAVEESSFASLP